MGGDRRGDAVVRLNLCVCYCIQDSREAVKKEEGAGIAGAGWSRLERPTPRIVL